MSAGVIESYARIESPHVPLMHSKELVPFAQSDAFFHLSAEKSARRARLRQVFAGLGIHKVILGGNISGFDCQLPGCTVEYLEKDFFDVATPEAFAQKVARLDGAVVILNNNDVGRYQESYAMFYKLCERSVFVAWDWDNHHWLDLSTFLAAHSDVYAPAHHENLYLLTRYNWAMLGPVYAATVQWSRKFLTDSLPAMITTPRSDAPLGKHVPYKNFTYRNRVVNTLSQHYPSIGFSDRNFHVRSPEERLQEWCAHKVHWIAPVLNDVAIRVFDAMITGGIPVLPASMQGLPPIREIDRKHIVFSKPEDILDPRALIARANALFDEGGADGIVSRHRYALENHHGDRRMRYVLDFVKELFL